VLGPVTAGDPPGARLEGLQPPSIADTNATTPAATRVAGLRIAGRQKRADHAAKRRYVELDIAVP
jgi:hypothetical protein